MHVAEIDTLFLFQKKKTILIFRLFWTIKWNIVKSLILSLSTK